MVSFWLIQIPVSELSGNVVLGQTTVALGNDTMQGYSYYNIYIYIYNQMNNTLFHIFLAIYENIEVNPPH